jgi:hypothetical protein
MNRHRYLRAYMAGSVLPTMFLLVVMIAFTVIRYVYDVPIRIERVIVFPMALIPNAWGLWNMLYVWLRGHRSWPIGLHGALLAVLIVPIGFSLATLLGFALPYRFLGVLGSVAAMAAYYLAYYLLWKYVVNFLNELLEIP